MVYVNTLRDLDVMVRAKKHFESRVHEAVRYEYLSESQAEAYDSWSQPIAQHFYGSYLRTVNGQLHQWLGRCLPHRFVHISPQRLVMGATPASTGADVQHAGERCFDDALSPLLRMLKVDDWAHASNATRAFLISSRRTVMDSLDVAAKSPIHLPHNDPALTWPDELNVGSCQGPIHPHMHTQ